MGKVWSTQLKKDPLHVTGSCFDDETKLKPLYLYRFNYYLERFHDLFIQCLKVKISMIYASSLFVGKEMLRMTFAIKTSNHNCWNS